MLHLRYGSILQCFLLYFIIPFITNEAICFSSIKLFSPKTPDHPYPKFLIINWKLDIQLFQTWLNHSDFFFTIVMIYLFIQKLLWDPIFVFGKCPNRKMSLSLSWILWFMHLRKSKIESESSIETNYYIITIVKKIQSDSIMFKKVENPIFNWKFIFSDRGGQGFFCQKSLIFFGCVA